MRWDSLSFLGPLARSWRQGGSLSFLGPLARSWGQRGFALLPGPLARSWGAACWRRLGHLGSIGAVQEQPGAVQEQQRQRQQRRQQQRRRQEGRRPRPRIAIARRCPPKRQRPSNKEEGHTPSATHCPGQCRPPHRKSWPGNVRATQSAACGNSGSFARSCPRTFLPTPACAHSALRCAGRVVAQAPCRLR